jgi:DNA polymerase (family 10)
MSNQGAINPRAAAAAMSNQSIAERFELMGKMTDLLGEDSFRAAASAKAARILSEYPDSLSAIVTSTATTADAKKRLQSIDGVGPKIADKIIECVTTGKIAELEELATRVPPGLLALLEIPGLGPKTVSAMWNQAGVTSLTDLKRIIADGSILNLPRMGAKSVEKLKESIALAEAGQQRMQLGLAMVIAERIVHALENVPGVKRATFAGSLRRGKETIGDIDILVSTTDPERVSKAFVELPGVQSVIAAGATKTSVRMAVSVETGRWKMEGQTGDAYTGPSMQVDLRVIDEAVWGAALLYFTGSKEHNVKLRERALRRGVTLNEYGVFPEDGIEEPPQKRGIKAIACASEEDVYRSLGLKWIPPELREDRGEVEAFELVSAEAGPSVKGSKVSTAAAGAASKKTLDASELVTLESIKAELHAHTKASDGVMTIVELALAAKARGFTTLAVTDHSKSSVIANGLSPERLRAHIKAVHEANERVEGIRILAGSEVDILSDGTLDYDDDLLAELDIVVASPHAALGQDSPTATKRLLKAIAHPSVRIVGHPTGRLINRRAGLSPEMREIIAAAVEHNVALEINAHWLRLDLRDSHVRQAVEAGALITIDCDVHEMADFDNLRFGVMTGRRGWLTKERCVNTWETGRIVDWLKRH